MIDKIKKVAKKPSIGYWFFVDKLGVAKKNREFEGDGPIKTRTYDNYDEYVEHQKSKLKRLDLDDYNLMLEEEMTKRFTKQKDIKKGMNCLCLAARLGGEVKAFSNVGCFAVGIDLNPGNDNKYVLTGDFHNLQFTTGVVDIVFSNSLDHVLDYDKLIEEIKRVLKTNGLLILDMNRGTHDGKPQGFGYYEANQWNNIDDAIKLFTDRGFKKVKDIKFSKPWDGRQITLKLK